MAKLIATIKAIFTRLVFAAHSILAIWQVTIFKNNSFYWYLSSPILLLFFEGVFTLTIKENQEWKWFCPSVFLYLASIVPAIWLLELDKVDRRLRIKEETFNVTSLSANNLKELRNLIGVEIKLPEISLSTETWITLIEQFLMLILIIGRWMLPKGDLTRDQLSQLLLVYIGTAADIIEFFDSFKDDKIASEPILVLLTLAIWSWSLMQFTIVLTATKARKSRLSGTKTGNKTATSGCCSIDVWGIALNITLQDAPFLVFRLLIITHFNIISYMNVFFTCKNTLVILLQLYRLHVVQSESSIPKQSKTKLQDFQLTDISIISRGDMSQYGHKSKRTPISKDGSSQKSSGQKTKYQHNSKHILDLNSVKMSSELSTSSESEAPTHSKCKHSKQLSKHPKKDTGYFTCSSQTSAQRGSSRDKKTRKETLQKKLKRVESISESISAASGGQELAIDDAVSSFEREKLPSNRPSKIKSNRKLVRTRKAQSHSSDSD